MQDYLPRTIQFKEIIQVNDWKVKVYSITKNGQFDTAIFYSEVIKQLPEWLTMGNSFNANHNHMAFLILHLGTEGIFSLINWWVGENMLNTHIFLSSYDSPTQFQKISGDGLLPCIWELEIINHEKTVWVEHVLKQPKAPNYEMYLTATLNANI